MATQPIDADYLIAGAGAVGMAFADSLFTETDATIAIVDRRDRAGGHWNDAYPFVRLHQPSSWYGLGSAQLGTGRIDDRGLNAGLYELATGNEVVNHFDTAMRERFLPSGRVQFIPMSEVVDDGAAVVSRLTGDRTDVTSRHYVDGTWSQMRIPSTSTPPYEVAPDVRVVPINELPRVAPDYEHFVVVGAGKTGMDACTWLIERGVGADRIRWVVPRDSWVLNRENLQPGGEFFARFCGSLADQAESVVQADSVEDLFARLEASGELSRIDPDVTPTMYRCATLNEAELTALRSIEDVVRLGRVTSIDGEQIHLDQGTVPAKPNSVYVDCSAAGIPAKPSTPVFSGNRITPQWIRTCQPAFSAALIGHIEASYDDEDEKNRLCAPISPPAVPDDWLRMFKQELQNRLLWTQYPELEAWITNCRLDPFRKQVIASLPADTTAAAHLGRYAANVGPAAAKLEELLPA
jgi:hypothetical protein